MTAHFTALLIMKLRIMGFIVILSIRTTIRIMNHSVTTTVDINCCFALVNVTFLMEQHTLKNVNNELYINIYSYLETSGGKSSNLYLNVVHFFPHQY